MPDFDRLSFLFRRAVALPPHVALARAFGMARKKVRSWSLRRLHRYRPSHRSGPGVNGSMHRYLHLLSAADLLPPCRVLQEVADHYLVHRFDLLGSGWVQVKHGLSCRGVGGHLYPPGPSITTDPSGQWLAGRVDAANLEHSQGIWALVGRDYQPIDWQLDFKSGYRWQESVWSSDLPIGHRLGVDIKVPWELARMQHLPQLARAYGLACQGAPGFKNGAVYLGEVRSQILDFIATNPPSFGVNWVNAMEVGVRAVNWLVAIDLLRTFGASFDTGFEAVLQRSIYQHGRFVFANLEWHPETRGNHYLADIAGLLFIAAYLPQAAESDQWLSFSVKELLAETERQFHSDGGNFESSTSYHRLSGEMVLFATALTLGLPPEKRRVLSKFPATAHMARIRRLVAFTRDITGSNGRVPQIGDNDSGRFLKLRPSFTKRTVAEAKRHYSSLHNYSDLADDAVYWDENCLDHSHLVGAAAGLFPDLVTASGEVRDSFDRNVLLALSGQSAATASSRGKNVLVRPAAGSDKSDPTLHAFPNFGLYVFHTSRFYLALRCGHLTTGNAGHAHNDQLSFVLSVDGIPFIEDPGSYLYTALPEERIRFRSTSMHNTLALANQEQNPLEPGLSGLFRMDDRARGRVVDVSPDRFEAEHEGFGAIHRRIVEIGPERITFRDMCSASGIQRISLILSPQVHVDIQDRRVRLSRGKICAWLSSARSKGWKLGKSAVSTGYGRTRPTHVVCIDKPAAEDHFDWEISVH